MRFSAIDKVNIKLRQIFHAAPNLRPTMLSLQPVLKRHQDRSPNRNAHAFVFTDALLPFNGNLGFFNGLC